MTDLLDLRDIGYGSQSTSPAAITISPDGRTVAFQVRRARPDTNSYCLGVYALDLTARSEPRLLSAGGELIRDRITVRGVEAVATGLPTPITPKWSPDGTSIAFLKRMDGRTQVWAASATAERQITQSATDVIGFQWSRSGQEIVHSSKIETVSTDGARPDEALRGFRYDGRFAPNSRSTPFALGPRRAELVSTSISTGLSGPTSSQAAKDFDADQIRTRVDALSLGGDRAWAQAPDTDAKGSTAVRVRLRDGKDLRCDKTQCSDPTAIWWSRDAAEVWFQRREGWANSETAIYRWNPRSGNVQRVVRTPDLIFDCAPAVVGTVCLHESANQPRRIVLIARDGRISALLDPNPQFAVLKLGKVERLYWRNGAGVEVFGDLVLPPGHQPGQRHPLIIVQYRSRGFLRGGVGDEYPIQLLAQQGYAVLSFDSPSLPQALIPAPGAARFKSTPLRAMANRRNIETALQAGIDLVLQRGVVDGDRIGITGLSDGASTAQFSLIHANRYAAASMSSCCEDPSMMSLPGPVFASERRAAGWPLASTDLDGFWDGYSLARNATKVSTPILMQLCDDEYILSLEAHDALRSAHTPTDLYVFPNETHVKWQPAHRKEIYRRNVAWFNFWLRGIEDTTFGRSDEYDAWRKLKEDAISARKRSGEL